MNRHENGQWPPRIVHVSRDSCSARKPGFSRRKKLPAHGARSLVHPVDPGQRYWICMSSVFEMQDTPEGAEACRVKNAE
jgi:hypothetical protein